MEFETVANTEYITWRERAAQSAAHGKVRRLDLVNPIDRYPQKLSAAENDRYRDVAFTETNNFCLPPRSITLLHVLAPVRPGFTVNRATFIAAAGRARSIPGSKLHAVIPRRARESHDTNCIRIEVVRGDAAIVHGPSSFVSPFSQNPSRESSFQNRDIGAHSGRAEQARCVTPFETARDYGFPASRVY